MDLSEIEKLDSPVKTLKLSEAIRIGARLRTQTMDGDVFAYGRSCAIGAAIEGRGGKYSELSPPWHLVPELVLCHVYTELGKQVYRLNDRDRMTREQIADILESEGL